MAHREIILSDKHNLMAKVSEEDYAFLVRWRWTFKRSSQRYNGSVYACRNTWVGSRRTNDVRQVKIMMHNLVLELMGLPRPDGCTAHHKNGDPLDNRRSNLEWATLSKQNKEAWKKRKRNGSPAAGHRDDGPDRQPDPEDHQAAPPD